MPLKPHLVVTIIINLIRQKDTYRREKRKYVIFLNLSFSPSYKLDPLCRYKKKTLKYATADLISPFFNLSLTNCMNAGLFKNYRQTDITMIRTIGTKKHRALLNTLNRSKG